MDEVLKSLGIEIDKAFYDKNLQKLIELKNRCLDQLEKETGQNRVIIQFYEANCYGYMLSIRRQLEGVDFNWSQDEKVHEVLALRRAISEKYFEECDHIFQCKILTNTGNALNQLGRFIEAIRYWDEALKIIPNFAMALGAKGGALISYAHSLYDQGHAGILFANANIILKEVISTEVLWDGGEHPEAKNKFQEDYDYTVKILDSIDYDYNFDLNQYSLGDTSEEVDYNAWCLSFRLFLSPINDVTRVTAAAHDPLHLPSHTYNVDEEARFPKYYNVLKQEYVAARYMFYKAISGRDQHIADKGVLLLSGMDGACFGYKAEQMKTAYRLAYSMFDKIAVFINDYFSVGLIERSVYFRSVWSQYDKESKEYKVLPVFEESCNWPLRGLYYLSKDIHDERFKDTSLSNAQELANIRNTIEHCFLSLQEYDSNHESTKIHSYLAKDDFEKKTLRILSMAREGLIYLSLAMKREEDIRREKKDINQSKLVFPVLSEPIIKSERLLKRAIF